MTVGRSAALALPAAAVILGLIVGGLAWLALVVVAAGWAVLALAERLIRRVVDQTPRPGQRAR